MINVLKCEKMKQKLYQKKNNIFQSQEWLNFQNKYGRELTNLGGYTGIALDLPFGKKAIWVQKCPADVSHLSPLTSELPAGTAFVRVEPETVSDNDIKKLSLRKVTEKSLLSGQKSPKATRVLDISGSEENILSQMKSKTRYNIRLAEKKSVTIRDNGSVEEFYELLAKTAGRDKGYSPHQKDYYQALMDELGPGGMIKIFVAEHEGEALAGIMVSFYGEVATYLHGGFNDTKRNLMAPYLCQWEAIKYAKSNGCTLYDFWGVAETDDPQDPWSGISRFKEGFGGEKVTFPGSYDLVLDNFWYNLLTLMARARKVFR